LNLRDLRDADRLDYRGAALALSEARGLFLISVDAAELFAVGVGYGD
jgi:hypothetical protein